MTVLNNRKHVLALSITAALFASQSYLAVAAEKDSVERIQVTGSHIQRTDMEGPSPLTSLSAEDIANSGVTDLIGLFTKLPMAGQGTFSTQGNSSDNTSNGGSSVSLRGLGADSTLILVNGRRVSVSPFANNIDTAFVDINNIPLAAIKRVDILKDGASATYGSDAVAGVINIILRDDVEGAEISAKLGDTADGGGKEKNLSIVWGSSTEKSSHTFALDYFDREEILYADRDYSKSANQKALRPNDPFATDFRSSSGFPGTIALASDSTNRLPDTFGNDVCAEADIVGNLCRYDYAPVMTSVPATERASFIYLGKYEINDNLRGFAELNGQHSKTTIRGAGSPSFNELFMAGDNVNHPFANLPTHEFYQQDLTMRRRMLDIGNREKRVTSNYYRSIIGLQGEIKDWSWEVAYNYIKSESTERGVNGFPNSRRTQEAIDSGLWNPFEPSSNSQESLDFIETTTTRIGKSTSKSFDGKISGSLMEMAHGDLGLAVGVEYREESISDNPDDQFLRGEVFGTEATQANGSRDNTSIFAELAIPVLDNLEVQVAVRHEDYSDFGTTTDPKVAFIWQTTDSLSLRGSYGTAFRAPSLHQIGLGNTDESPNLVDSVRCAAVGNVNKACEPQEYTAVLSGNDDLGPEESKSYNLGLIYELADNMDFSVDYYDYDIENVITKDTQFKFSTLGNDPSVVERLPSSVAGDPGEVVRIFDQYENIGNITTSGLDVEANYGLETDMGDFRFTYALNYVLSYEDARPNADGSMRIDTQEGDFEQPEVRWSFNTVWVQGDWNASMAVNYVGEFKQDAAVAAEGMNDIDSLTTVDTTVNYIGIKDTTLSIGATNLFNEEPPFSYHDFTGFVSGTHNSQGRFVYVKASYKF
ncbi:TonB-dependent receptor [Colwellia sp. MB02u-18]|uniref:TonB-dependent receptor plug domain-containing protein n=1 Tax=unclassified Colwellia TaxID=196834 RepID=UPI0015F5E01A|nr:MULTISPECIES: TonB-dependent receptor [unclassified Colwellia]MBA6223322.1 TonB-dependent receptor [Colwellia sp. MB3u-45]MBA6267850.1 TonB-dependent receptor [Colwellia sp. MB3u-43]MBA6296855.1 TonB-dependent receptor [Colwellia sp. MB02u-9]MBA6322296.1 TonB-dependent receptor [Colwellia sp. MB02u-19]MBA6323891.1 TonB-dependent receptor [Colwellia sp. MB02u-18]